MDSCPPNKINLIKDFQSIIFSIGHIIFSPCCDQFSVIKEKIEEIKDFFSPSEIDHQLIPFPKIMQKFQFLNLFYQNQL